MTVLSLLYLMVRYDLSDGDTYLRHGDRLMANNERRMARRAYEQALESYSAAFRLDPKNVGLCQRTGDLLHDLRQVEKAVHVYKTCLAADSTAAHLAHFWGLIGSLHLQEKDYAAAEAALDTALQHDADHLASWIKRSLLFIDTGRLDEGLDALNRAVSLDHETGVAWYYRARIRAWRGETALASEDLATAIRMDSTIAIRARKKPELAFYFNRE